MIKNIQTEESYFMSDETNEGKIIVFNPAGFFLKLIFTIAIIALMGSTAKDSMEEKGGLLYVIFFYVMMFCIFWFAASMFGFCLRASGNYIIAAILMVVLIALFSAGITWLDGQSRTLGNIAAIIFILLLVWLPINDIRKAILYFKNTF